MKWPEEKIEQLKSLAQAGTPNKEIKYISRSREE